MGRISRRVPGHHRRRLPSATAGQRVMDITADAPALPQGGLSAASLAFHTGGRPESVGIVHSMDQHQLTLETLLAAIACSPIMIARPAPRLPAGFEDIDMAILNWIAAEARLSRRVFVLM